MSQKILQINVNTSVPKAELEQGWLKAAEAIAEQDGLIWKIWIINEETEEAGGWYLFESEDHAQAYLDGELVAAFRNNPLFRNISAKLYDPVLSPTEITRGLAALNAR